MLLRSWPARGLSSTSRLAGLLAATAALALPAAALATPSLVVDGTLDLGGDALPFYDALTVKSTGVLRVKPYQAMSTASTGWLTIKANTITVEMGGMITADAAGYPGVDGKAGVCELAIMPPLACAGAGMAAGQPGGGGGFFGTGANGALEMTAGTCTDLMGAAAGGIKFFDMTAKTLDLGSAGGAGNLVNPALTAGGSGGGGIRLLAAVVTIDGTVSANGKSAVGFGGVGPGGGSGGAIEITAATLKGAGTLSVKGGDGAHSNGIPGTWPANNGGGGSGGVVLFNLPPGATSPLKLVADGGKTGGCSNFPGPAGGSVTIAMSGSCVDVDGDMHPSMACGGDDCDDSDPAVHPGAPEICNGKSDNCGPIDAPPNDCTMMGEVCGMSGGVPACVAAPSDAGAGGGPGGLEYIQYGGGCEVPESLPSRGTGALMLGMAAVGLAARRRRR